MNWRKHTLPLVVVAAGMVDFIFFEQALIGTPLILLQFPPFILILVIGLFLVWLFGFIPSAVVCVATTAAFLTLIGSIPMESIYFTMTAALAPVVPLAVVRLLFFRRSVWEQGRDAKASSQ